MTDQRARVEHGPTRETLRLALWDAVYRAEYRLDLAFERERALGLLSSAGVDEARAIRDELLARVPLIDPLYVSPEALRCPKCGAPPGSCDVLDGGLCRRRVA